MQRTKDPDRSARPWVTKLFRFSFLLLPALAVTPVSGQESSLTLALVSYDQSLAQPAATVHDDPVASPLSDASAPRIQYQITGLNLDRQNTISPSPDFLFEKSNGSNLFDRFQLVDKKLNADGQTGSRMHVEAGYGQFCQYGACFGCNAAELELQAPNCAYLRACFSF